MPRYGFARRVAGLALSRLTTLPTPADRFHFVRDYRRLVRDLLAVYPRDEAMSLATGGLYAEMGDRLARVMAGSGLRDGMALLDLGCGSGRLAAALSQRMEIDYLGLDVIPELLAYARTRCPSGYRFRLNHALSLPAPDAAFDRLSALSVFTHLRHEESFLYLREAARVLKPGGAVVLSFLEFAQPQHWSTFMGTVDDAATDRRGQLNVFIEAEVLALWAERLGFAAPEITRVGEAGAGGEIGQSVAVMRKPA